MKRLIDDVKDPEVLKQIAIAEAMGWHAEFWLTMPPKLSGFKLPNGSYRVEPPTQQEIEESGVLIGLDGFPFKINYPK